jgi:hypothetical protein
MEWRVRDPEKGGTWEVPRTDQSSAITNYITTLERKQNVPHSMGGEFKVNFGDITTSYTKDNGTVVEVMFGSRNNFIHSNRVTSVFKSTKRKSAKRKSTKRKSTKRKTYI